MLLLSPRARNRDNDLQLVIHRLPKPHLTLKVQGVASIVSPLSSHVVTHGDIKETV